MNAAEQLALGTVVVGLANLKRRHLGDQARVIDLDFGGWDRDPGLVEIRDVALLSAGRRIGVVLEAVANGVTLDPGINVELQGVGVARAEVGEVLPNQDCPSGDGVHRLPGRAGRGRGRVPRVGRAEREDVGDRGVVLHHVARVRDRDAVPDVLPRQDLDWGILRHRDLRTGSVRRRQNRGQDREHQGQRLDQQGPDGEGGDPTSMRMQHGQGTPSRWIPISLGETILPSLREFRDLRRQRRDPSGRSIATMERWIGVVGTVRLPPARQSTARQRALQPSTRAGERRLLPRSRPTQVRRRPRPARSPVAPPRDGAPLRAGLRILRQDRGRGGTMSGANSASQAIPEPRRRTSPP